MTNVPQQNCRRPIGVWIVLAFYLITGAWMFLSYALIFTNPNDLTPAQVAYFSSLTAVDWFFSLSITIFGIAGAITLFMLKKQAVILFLSGLIINLVMTAYHLYDHALRTTWAEAMEGSALSSTAYGLGLNVIMILYAYSLAKGEVLK